jgi:hypothetical protein
MDEMNLVLYVLRGAGRLLAVAVVGIKIFCRLFMRDSTLSQFQPARSLAKMRWCVLYSTRCGCVVWEINLSSRVRACFEY